MANGLFCWIKHENNFYNQKYDLTGIEFLSKNSEYDFGYS